MPYYRRLWHELSVQCNKLAYYAAAWAGAENEPTLWMRPNNYTSSVPSVN